jgi:Kef-type K+ transport system membrane component KefB
MRLPVRLSLLFVLAIGALAPAIARADDAGTFDASIADAGPIDAGVPSDAMVDAGVPADASALEGAALDAGPALAEATSEPTPPAVPSPSAVIRTLLGLVALLALAYLGGLPRVQRIEERLGIAQVMTSGLPYVLLGLLARSPALNVLNDDTMRSILPLLQFGLGWIGFQTGFSFEASAMDRVARGTGTVVILLTGFPFLAIASASALLLWLVGLGPDPLALARDACLLGLAGALSAPTLERVIGQKMSTRALELARAVGHLDDVVGVIALACLAAFLHARAPGIDWQLPGVGWVFVTFGMAVTIGLVVYAVLRGTDSSAEKISLLLGSVALTAGLAGFLSLSPLVICFLAGVLLRNLPGDDKAQLAESFRRLERPIYLLFLVIVGGLWKIDDWRGWVLLPIFVLARFAGRFLGARTARALPERDRPPALEETQDRDLVTPPMGQLALAFVVTAQTLYESPAVQAVVTAVVGGAVLIEIVVQISARRARPHAAPQPPEDALSGQDRVDEHVPPEPRPDEPKGEEG